jgi:hypothetical protein
VENARASTLNNIPRRERERERGREVGKEREWGKEERGERRAVREGGG